MTVLKPGSVNPAGLGKIEAMEKIMRKYLVAIPLSLLAFAMPTTPAAAAETVTFQCGAQQSQTCYFSILPYNGGISNFTLRGGESHQQSGLEPGRDRYIVTIDRPTPADWGRCVRQEGGWCNADYVKRGLNR